MKIERLIKVNKKTYEEKYKTHETKEIHIDLKNGYQISIAEQQVGLDLDEPYFHILTPKGMYSMDYESFINKIMK